MRRLRRQGAYRHFPFSPLTWAGAPAGASGRPRRRRPRPLGRVLLAGVALCGALSTGTLALALAGAAPAAATLTSAPTSTNTATDTASTSVPAYWLVASDGGVFAFGGAGFYGSTGSLDLVKPVVGMAGTPDSEGYWLVAADGGIFTFGDAVYYGSMGGKPLNEPVVAMAATPNGQGYWLVASDGGIFCFGNAQFYGSMGGRPLNEPIVGMASTPDGRGYWLVAADGGIFAFGDANFYGSTGGMALNAPIVAMSPSADGQGYTLVASDGGTFAYGDANFYGSLGGTPLQRPIVAMAATPNGQGYWMTNNNGGVTAFGAGGYYGSAPQVLNDPIVGITEGAGNGSFAMDSYPSGSYGYDISNWNCADQLPSGHTIGIVEVEGGSFASVNSCLSEEAAWAGAGLNLYIYLTYGTQSSGPAICNGDQACNYGFAAAEDAFTKAQSAGVDTQVTWWLDVEDNSSWSSSTAENAQMVEGAIDGLRAEALNNVGIYASPDVWSGIVGDYQPAVPYWMAWWSGDGGQYNCENAAQIQQSDPLPTGPVVITQYTDNASGFDGDYAC